MKKHLVFITTFLSFNLTAQFAEITPDDLGFDDFYGFNIHLEADDLLINARFSDAVFEDSGALYHYVQDGPDWKLNQKLMPQLPDDANSNAFGGFIALSDNWLATSIIDNEMIESIIFFERQGSEWIRHSKVTNDIPDVGFGWGLELDNNTAVIGCVGGFNDSGIRTGIAYVYEYDTALDEWVEAQVLSPLELGEDDFFGSDIYIKDDLIAVSARKDSENSFQSGAVYVFEKEQSGWRQTDKLIPADASAQDFIGYRVNGDGDRLIVSGYGADNEKGSAYIFRNENGWAQEAKLDSDDLQAGDWFGSGIALEGDRAIVGARNHNGENGAVYVFDNMGGSWVQTHKFEAPEDIEAGRFGTGLAYQNNKLVVGAPWANDLVGAAYVVDFNDLTLATQEVSPETVTFYPNPTKSEFQLQTTRTNISEVEIYAADGKLVMTYDHDASVMDVSHLISGSYTIKAKTEDGKFAVGKLTKID